MGLKHSGQHGLIVRGREVEAIDSTVPTRARDRAIAGPGIYSFESQPARGKGGTAGCGSEMSADCYRRNVMATERIGWPQM